jgi:hypothetical protein
MITQEMRDFFYRRTKEHIGRVKKWINTIYKYDPIRFSKLLDRRDSHDKSKFSEPELTPYIYITWRYHCQDTGEKFEVSDDIQRLMRNATYLHVKSSSHHPEFHDPGASRESINDKDRDGIPKKIVTPIGMTDIDIADMVADWMAMADEKGTDPKEWADKNIGKRWKFNDNQIKLIYELLKLYPNKS